MYHPKKVYKVMSENPESDILQKYADHLRLVCSIHAHLNRVMYDYLPADIIVGCAMKETEENPSADLALYMEMLGILYGIHLGSTWMGKDSCTAAKYLPVSEGKWESQTCEL